MTIEDLFGQTLCGRRTTRRLLGAEANRARAARHDRRSRRRAQRGCPRERHPDRPPHDLRPPFRSRILVPERPPCTGLALSGCVWAERQCTRAAPGCKRLGRGPIAKDGELSAFPSTGANGRVPTLGRRARKSSGAQARPRRGRTLASAGKLSCRGCADLGVAPDAGT